MLLMSGKDQFMLWGSWLWEAKNIWLRRAVFQVHVWTGIGLGVYILLMSITGSVLVYSNELYTAATLEPVVSKSSSPRLTDDQLMDAAKYLFPGYSVLRI